MIQTFLAPHAERTYAVLRIVSGFMFACHGAQKLFGVFGEPQKAIGSQLWFGGLIELVCGAAIAIGFFTSWAAFLASGTMAVAYIQFHWNFQFGSGLFPIVNKGEHALLYAFLFLFMACKGDGTWSVRLRVGKGRDAA